MRYGLSILDDRNYEENELRFIDRLKHRQQLDVIGVKLKPILTLWLDDPNNF